MGCSIRGWGCERIFKLSMKRLFKVVLRPGARTLESSGRGGEVNLDP